MSQDGATESGVLDAQSAVPGQGPGAGGSVKDASMGSPRRDGAQGADGGSTLGAGGARGTGGATSSNDKDAAVDAMMVACPAGRTVCDGKCVDTSKDANHCGACGHTCYLGACNGTCQPWKIVDAPDTSVPALLVTDGTTVVWVDTGLTSIRQAKFDRTGVMTLSKDATAFASARSPFNAPITLGSGTVVVATDQGIYQATIDRPSNASTHLALKIPTGAGLSSVGLDTTGKHLGLAALTESPQMSQIYECQLGDLSCVPVGAPFLGGVYGAAANSTAYYYMETQNSAVRYFTFGSPTVKTLQAYASITLFVALDSTGAYWWCAPGAVTAAICRGALSNGSTSEVVTGFPANGSEPRSLAADGKNVYFAAAGDSAYIGYAPVGGVNQTAKILATVSTAIGVAAAGGKVFWIDGTAIWATAAP
jgi:hypothetical protein